MHSNDNGQPPIGPDPEKGRPVSIGDMIRQCNDAASKMSNVNPHKTLLLNCAYALKQLVVRIDELETQLNPPTVN